MVGVIEKFLKRLRSLGAGQHLIVLTLDREGNPISLSVQGSAKVEQFDKHSQPNGRLNPPERS